MNAPWFPLSLVELLGWVLVHSVWQFAALSLVALILDQALRGASATVRYGALLTTLLAMPVAPIVTLAYTSAEEPSVGLDSNRIPTGTATRIVATEDETRPKSREKVPLLDSGVSAAEGSTFTRPEIGRGDSDAVAATWESWRNGCEQAVRPWLGWIVGFWSLGVSGFALRPVLGWRYVRQLRRVGVSPVPAGIASSLERLARRLRLKQGIQLLQSSLVATPMVIGYFRPLILLPVGLVTGLPVAQLEAILAHELAHVRRLDYLVNFLQSLIETVFFYHPAVWWLSSRIRTERENCCDDVAIAVLENRIEYGRALLALEELRGEAPLLALGAHGGTLLARIRRILGVPSRPQAIRSGSLLAGALVVVGLILGSAWTSSPAGDRDPWMGHDDPALAEGLAWPQWGGSSRRNNVSAATNLPVTWSQESGQNVAWRADLGSQTYASPVVSGGRILIGTNNGRGLIPRFPAEQDVSCLLCFDEQMGEFLWQYSSEKLPNGLEQNGPGRGLCSTPCVIGDRAWLTTNRGEVVCLDLAGFRDDQDDGPVVDESHTGIDEADVVWRFDMRKELGVIPHYQSCSSVTVVGDLVLLNTAHSPEGFDRPAPGAGAATPPDATKQPPSFLAIDRHTGHVVWPDNSPGLNVLGYECPASSPSAGEIGGVWQAVFAGADGWLYAFDLAEMNRGKSRLLWEFDGNKKMAQHVVGEPRKNMILGSPMIHDGRVYVAMGQNPEHGEGPGHLWCIDPTRRGDISPELVFTKVNPDKPIPHQRLQAGELEEGDFTRPNPNSGVVWHYEGHDSNGDAKVAFEETMHRCSGSVVVHDGLLVAADVSGLVTCLDARLGRPYWTHDLLSACWSTPVIAEGRIFVADEDGEMEVLRLATKKEVLATNYCGASTYGTPAIANGTIYVPTNTQLLALRKLEPPPDASLDVVAQIPDAAYTRPTADDQRATATIPAEAWGKPVDGLRAAIVLRSPPVDKHERLCYDIVAENVSDHDIRFSAEVGIDTWHFYFTSKLVDADGKQVAQQRGGVTRLGHRLVRIWLKPKERHVIFSWASTLLKLDEEGKPLARPEGYGGSSYFSVKPGRYSLSAAVELGPSWYSTDPASGKRTVLSPATGEWSGKLQTGAAPVALFTQPAPADEAAAKHPAVIDVSATGTYTFDGQAIGRDDLDAALRKAGFDPASTTIQLRAEPDTPYDAVVTLLDRLKEAGWGSITLGAAEGAQLMGDVLRRYDAAFAAEVDAADLTRRKLLALSPELAQLALVRDSDLLVLEVRTGQVAHQEHVGLGIDEVVWTKAGLLVLFADGRVLSIKLPVRPEVLKALDVNGSAAQLGLQGTWELIGLVVDGTNVTVAGQEMKVVVKDDQLTYFYGGKDETRRAEFRIALDPSQEPAEIDATSLNGIGPLKGQVYQGIYEQERDNLWICLPDKPGVERPKTPESTAGSQLQFLMLRRVQAQPASADDERAHPPDPMDGLTICGLDLSGYPSTFDKGTLPGLLVSDPEHPGQKRWAANLLSMPIYKSDPYATLDYPVGSGHFFVSVREDQRTRTYGPIDGDPFDLLGLDQSMHELLRDAVESPNDALLRLRQLLSRDDDKLCRRGFSMVQELPVPSDRRTLDGLIEVLEQVAAQSTDAQFKAKADTALERVRDLKAKSVARWESRRVLLADTEYSAGNDSEPSAQIVWGKPHPASGLQVGFSLKPLPASQAKPDINGFQWQFGDPLLATVFVRAQGDAPVKFTSTSRADEGLRLWLLDEAGQHQECGIGAFTSPLQEERFRLSQGQWIELKEHALTATQLPAEVEEPRFHGGFLVPAGQYALQVELTIAGFESGGATGPITVPAAGEWTGVLTSGSIPVSVAAADVPVEGDAAENGDEQTGSGLVPGHFGGALQVMRIGPDGDISYGAGHGLCQMTLFDDDRLKIAFHNERQIWTDVTLPLVTRPGPQRRASWSADMDGHTYLATAIPIATRGCVFRLEKRLDGKLIHGSQQFFAVRINMASGTPNPVPEAPLPAPIDHREWRVDRSGTGVVAGQYTGARQVMQIATDGTVSYTDRPPGMCQIAVLEDDRLTATFLDQRGMPAEVTLPLATTAAQHRASWSAEIDGHTLRATAVPYSSDVYIFRLEKLLDGKLIEGAQEFYAIEQKLRKATPEEGGIEAGIIEPPKPAKD